MMTTPLIIKARRGTVAEALSFSDARGRLRILPGTDGAGWRLTVNGMRVTMTPILACRDTSWGGPRLAHLTAALSLSGIHDATLEVTGRLPQPSEEVAGYCRLIASVGRRAAPGRLMTLNLAAEARIDRPDGSFASLSPSCGRGLRLEVVSDYPPPLGLQAARFHGERDDALALFGWARHGHDLAKPWRTPDEPGRHDLLDAYGVLACLPGEVQGTIRLFRPCPALLHDLSMALLPEVTLSGPVAR